MDEAPDREVGRTLRAIAFLDRSAEKPWFWPSVGVFPALDYFVPVLPNQLLMIALAMLHPRRWLVVALVFAAASALGASVTAAAIQAAGSAWNALFPFSSLGGEAWQAMVGHIDDWGLFALFALAMLPVPPRTAVLVCAAAGTAPLAVGLAVGCGRLLPATGISWLSANAPRHLSRLPLVGRHVAALAEIRRKA